MGGLKKYRRLDVEPAGMRPYADAADIYEVMAENERLRRGWCQAHASVMELLNELAEFGHPDAARLLDRKKIPSDPTVWAG